MGFGKKGKNSFTVQRSEEVLPAAEIRAILSRGSSASDDGEPLTVDGDRFVYSFFLSLLQLVYIK